MKKHLCRIQKFNAYGVDSIKKTYRAACDPTLEVPYHQRPTRNRRLTTEEIVKNMDKGNICKACIRIVVVERLNGIRPPVKVDIHVDAVDAAAAMARTMAVMGVTAKKAAISLGSLAKIMRKHQGLNVDQLGGLLPSHPNCRSVSVPLIHKDFSFNAKQLGELTRVPGIIGDVMV